MSLTRKTLFGCKTETTQGTAVSLAATDFMLAEVVEIRPTVDLIERNHLRSSISKLEHITGKRMLDITVKTENKWSGVGGTVYAPLAALFQASGLLQTIATGSESVGAASAHASNLGTSPAPVLTIAASTFKSVSGRFILTLTSKTTSNPEGAEFQLEWRPNNGGASEFATYTITDTAFADVAANEAGDIQDHIELTVNDPDAGGAGDPVTSWNVGDQWTFSYVSASQVSCGYTPTSTTITNFNGPGKSVTAEVWLDGPATGISHVAKGVLVVSARLSNAAGSKGDWEFTLRGLWQANPADAAFPSTSLLDVLPGILQSATLTMQGDTLCLANLELAIENTLAELECATAAYGLNGFMITERTITGKGDPVILAVATHPFIANYLAGTSMAFNAVWTVETGGSTPQKITIAGAQCQYISAQPGDRNGTRIMQMEWAFKSTVAGDDEFSMLYEEA